MGQSLKRQCQLCLKQGDGSPVSPHLIWQRGKVIEIIGKGTICKKSLLLAGKSQKSANLYIWKRFIHF